MAWLLDTNSWITVLKDPGGRLEQTILHHQPADICLCSIVKAELWHGANKYAHRDRRLAALQQLFASFVSYPFDDDAARDYAEIRHHLELAGMVIGPNDLKIAAICRARGLTLVTANTAEFVPIRPRAAFAGGRLDASLGVSPRMGGRGAVRRGPPPAAESDSRDAAATGQDGVATCRKTGVSSSFHVRRQEKRTDIAPSKLGEGGEDVTSTPSKPFVGVLWVTNPTR